MVFPDWLDYELSENAATAMFRGLRGLSGSWGELIASAQAIMGIYQDLVLEDVADLYSEQQVLPLIAASRILDTASQYSTEIPEEDRLNLGLSAAVAFAMYGNFPSAAAVVRRLGSLSNISPSIAIIIGTSVPRLLTNMLVFCENDSPHRRYLELLEYFLSTGEMGQIEQLKSAFIECLLEAPSAFEGSLFRSSRLCLEHILRLSVARVLHEERGNLPDVYIRTLVDSGVRVLLPPQFNAVMRSRLLATSDNTIVALPTSTGKTLLGEFCLVTALGDQPGIVCYIAPYVALGRQVVQELTKHLPSSIRIHQMMGGFRESEPLDPDNQQELVVATPERLDALLRTAPELIPFIRCIVCDESHSIQNNTRGIRLEGLLTRLRLLQNTGNRSRLVLLSAVLSKYEALMTWIGAPDSSIIVDTWRPTARRVAFWRQNDRLYWFVGDNPIRRIGTTSESVIGYADLPWPESNFYPTRNYGQVQQQEPAVHNNVAYLVSMLSQTYNGPVLCVCATKDSTRKVARAVASRFPVIEPLPNKIGAAIARIQTHYPFLLPLCELLKHGIAYHNSTVPLEVRQIIEEAVRDRELIAVASTTTLAEGVDLPFRFTIVVDWLLWQGSARSPMSSLLFKNIAGRCGRAGEFTEGDTILFDNPLGDPDYTHPYNRWRYQKQIFLEEQPAELTSAIEELSSDSEDELLLAVLASQFMAAIPENPDAENLAERFARNTFAAHRQGSYDHTYGIFSRITNSLLDESEGALARAASPLQLTLFGKAANNTGFSPFSCRAIVAFLRTLPRLSDTSADLVKFAGTLLRTLGSLPEQTNDDLRKVLANPKSRFLVKPNDIEKVTSMWLAGQPHEIIFADLPTVQKSKSKTKIEDWLAGLSASTTWDTGFDKFIEFMRTVFEGFMPWIIRACGVLDEFAGEPKLSDVDWQLWAAMIEHGVDSKWAINAITRGAPGGRQAIATVGRRWPLEHQISNIDPVNAAYLRRDLEARQKVEQLFRELLHEASRWNSPYTNDLRELRTWLWYQAGFSVRQLDEI